MSFFHPKSIFLLKIQLFSMNFRNSITFHLIEVDFVCSAWLVVSKKKKKKLTIQTLINLVNWKNILLRAYMRLVKREGEEPSLPGLPYTPRQLFWISGAAPWCTVMREEKLKNYVLTDYHSPMRYPQWETLCNCTLNPT